ncbi:MAG: hypothetical protein ACRC2T_11050 [Thermoguttaceae bacterium]
MKTNKYCLCVLILIFLTAYSAIASAQYDNNLTDLQNAAVRKMQSNISKMQSRSFWNGDTTVITATQLLHLDDFRNSIGITDEQYQKLQEADRPTTIPPEVEKLLLEQDKLNDETPGGVFGGNASDETVQKFLDMQ